MCTSSWQWVENRILSFPSSGLKTQLGYVSAPGSHVIFLPFFSHWSLCFLIPRQVLGIAWILFKWSRNFILDLSAPVSLVRCTLCVGFPPTMYRSQLVFLQEDTMCHWKGVVGWISIGKYEFSLWICLWSSLWESVRLHIVIRLFLPRSVCKYLYLSTSVRK